jgi:Fe-S-cluster containining protein
VPCGGCTACCASSQFVHIEPDEHDTLAHVPPELLFPAPFRPPGHVLLGYDEHGRCPMLGERGCSIYEHRPRTCRTYDCRVFAATGIEPDRGEAAVAQRVERWRFAFPTAADRERRAAVRLAVAHLDAHPDDVPPSARSSATQRAVLAVELHDLFLEKDAVDAGAVRVEIRRRTS